MHPNPKTWFGFGSGFSKLGLELRFFFFKSDSVQNNYLTIFENILLQTIQKYFKILKNIQINQKNPYKTREFAVDIQGKYGI